LQTTYPARPLSEDLKKEGEYQQVVKRNGKRKEKRNNTAQIDIKQRKPAEEKL